MKRLLFVSVLLAMIAACAVIAKAADAPTWFKWEQITDYHGKDDNAQSIAISGQTAVATEDQWVSNGVFDIAVKAFDVNTGQPLWEDRFLGDSKAPVAILGNTAIVAAFSNGLLVRGYNLTNGHILWTTYWAIGGYPTGMVAINNRVIVASNTDRGSIRTLDLVTGSLLWEATVTHAGYDDVIWTLASDGAAIVTAGNIINPNTGDRHLILRSYTFAGNLQWETVALNVAPTAVELTATRAIVAGGKQDSSGNLLTFFAGFNRSTGYLSWQEASTSGIFFALAANGAQAVAGGRTGERGLSVRSVHPETGAAQWESHTLASIGFGQEVLGVALTANNAYVVGHSWQDMVYSETLVRAYAVNGTLQFDDRRHRAISVLSGLAVAGANLLSVGYTKPNMSAASDAMVLAYDVSVIEPEFSTWKVIPGPGPVPIAFKRLVKARGK